MLRDNGSSIEVKQDNHYYAFGMKINELNPLSTNTNRATYNGKEYDNEINWYHYGARFYDPAVGRWWATDPMDEYYTPYSYVGNNVINAIDPDGMMTDFVNPDGTLIKHIDDGSNAVFTLTNTEMSEQFFKFSGYNDQGGIDKVNVSSVLSFAQEYFHANFTSTPTWGDIGVDGPIPKAKFITYCNFGTTAIAKSYASAATEAGYYVGPVSFLTGKANNMYDKLTNSGKLKLSRSQAKQLAQLGNVLVIGVWRGKGENSGHVYTVNSDGNVVNIGSNNIVNSGPFSLNGFRNNKSAYYAFPMFKGPFK